MKRYLIVLLFMVFSSVSYGANTKISDLSSGDIDITISDEIPVARGGANYKVTPQGILNTTNSLTQSVSSFGIDTSSLPLNTSGSSYKWTLSYLWKWTAAKISGSTLTIGGSLAPTGAGTITATSLQVNNLTENVTTTSAINTRTILLDNAGTNNKMTLANLKTWALGWIQSGSTSITGSLSASGGGTITATKLDIDSMAARLDTSGLDASNFVLDNAGTNNKYSFGTLVTALKTSLGISSGADGSYYILFPNNTTISPTAASNQIYAEGNVIKIVQNGNEYSASIGPTESQFIWGGSSDDPDVSVAGSIGFDTDGWLRVYNNTRQEALARTQEEIHVTVVKPNDLADATRDAFPIWSNESGMSFIITGWKAWSSTDDTTLNIEETDADGQNNATVDAVEIASNGTGVFYASDTTITGATVENGHLLFLDFDDTDDPGWVKLTIYGYYNADVN